ncbi:MAG: hypothetical protein JXC85_01535 [Candidatus Aenigmarchaeota archaeon]|nr:hypothetical protein [Candidatus Aenigmarchaeota archaeon]
MSPEMPQKDGLSTIIALGFGPFDTCGTGRYSLCEALSETSYRYGLGANIEWAMTRYEAKDLLEEYCIPTKESVRVNTGEAANGDPGEYIGPFVTWPVYQVSEDGDLRIFVCSCITVEEHENSTILHDGDIFAREIVKGIPKVITHYQDEKWKSSLPKQEILEYDYSNFRVFHLPRDLRTDESAQASIEAMDLLVKGLWDGGFDFPLGKYMDLATKADINATA